MLGPGPAVAGADILREESVDVGWSEVQVKVGCVLVTAGIQQAGDTSGGSYNRLLVAAASTELMSSGSYCNHKQVNINKYYANVAVILILHCVQLLKHFKVIYSLR